MKYVPVITTKVLQLANNSFKRLQDCLFEHNYDLIKQFFFNKYTFFIVQMSIYVNILFSMSIIVLVMLALVKTFSNFFAGLAWCTA